jgi:hypothetical protein
MTSKAYMSPSAQSPNFLLSMQYVRMIIYIPASPTAETVLGFRIVKILGVRDSIKLTRVTSILYVNKTVSNARIFIMFGFLFYPFEETTSFKYSVRSVYLLSIYTIREMHNSDTFEPATKPASWSHLGPAGGDAIRCAPNGLRGTPTHLIALLIS